jgi:sigma-E factor negative regulatory protein RseA
MDERLGESLSALMDDEANELEIERVLSLASGHGELRATWLRYNLVRQSLQGHDLPHAALDVSDRVRTALSGATRAGRGGRIRQRLVRPLTSLAVAASVAATVVIGGQQLAQLGGDPGYEPRGTVASDASPVGMFHTRGAMAVPASYGTQALPVLRPATRTAYNELAQQRSNRYLQEHAEQAALNAPQGLVPFARVRQIRE